MSKLYIAYGSNLNLEEMALRAPSARIYAKGLLTDWELLYRGTDPEVYATIQRKQGQVVPVVVWVITPEDEKKLDEYEEYPVMYDKDHIFVDLPSGKVKAMVYLMSPNQKPGIPSPEYIHTIRRGYLENGFDLAILNDSLVRNAIEVQQEL